MTDIYEMLRDRTTLGERIDAEAVHRDAPGTHAAPREATRGATMQADPDGTPLAKCASLLLDLADDSGEVTLDVVHWSGLSGCTLSVGASAGDGGAPQCLIKEPERPHDLRKKSGFSW
jgi:hypothetical protein